MTEHLQYIRGLPFPNIAWFTQKNIEETLDYIPQDGDVIIASYPKTGTNWLGHIVQQIVSNAKKNTKLDCASELHPMHSVPFLEMSGLEVVEKMAPPRIYKHHYPYNMVKTNEKSKYIYIYRKPEDAFVSFYYFMSNIVGKLDFEEYFEGFLSGQISYGRYFEHLLTYLKHRQDQNVLLVSYEKLHKNRREEILRIAKYLDEEYYHILLQDGEKLLKDIIERTNFEYMQKNFSVGFPDKRKSEDGTEKKMNFFRKGIVGDGKNVLSSEQLRRVRETALEVMKGTDILDEWYKE